MDINNNRQPFDFGRTMRLFRQEKGYTLEKAQQMTGVAKSTLSKIENNQISPSFETLQAIGIGLKIELPQLFERLMDKPKPFARLDITRAPNPDRLLAKQISNKKLIPTVLKISNRSVREFTEEVKDRGDAFLYVLKGSIVLFSEFYEPIELHKGDSIYYDCSMGQNLLSSGDEDAEVLWVTA